MSECRDSSKVWWPNSKLTFKSLSQSPRYYCPISITSLPHPIARAVQLFMLLPRMTVIKTSPWSQRGSGERVVIEVRAKIEGSWALREIKVDWQSLKNGLSSLKSQLLASSYHVECYIVCCRMCTQHAKLFRDEFEEWMMQGWYDLSLLSHYWFLSTVNLVISVNLESICPAPPFYTSTPLLSQLIN